MHRDEINQSLYYIANLINWEKAEFLDKVNDLFSFLFSSYIFILNLRLNNKNFQMKFQIKQKLSIYYKLL